MTWTWRNRCFASNELFPQNAGTTPDRGTIDAVLIDVRKQIGILDNAVAKTGYLAGEQLTLADLNLLPILDRVRLAPEGAEAFAATAHLSRYFETHASRPSFQRTSPPPGPPDRARAS